MFFVYAIILGFLPSFLVFFTISWLILKAFVKNSLARRRLSLISGALFGIYGIILNFSFSLSLLGGAASVGIKYGSLGIPILFIESYLFGLIFFLPILILILYPSIKYYKKYPN